MPDSFATAHREVLPTLPAAYVRDFLQGLAVSPQALQGLLHLSNISPTHLAQLHGRITAHQFSDLFRNLVVLLDDEMVGLYGRPSRSGTLKVLCLLMLSAPTLYVALRRWFQYSHVIDHGSVCSLWRDGGIARFRIVTLPRLSRNVRAMQEIHLKAVHGLSSWLIGKRIELRSVDFNFAAPEYATDSLFAFSGPVRYSQQFTEMTFAERYLDCAVKQRSMLELRELLVRAPLDWLFIPPSTGNTAHRVRDVLQANLHDDFDITRTAAILNISTRTLVRRLRNQSTSFQDVKDALRREIAVAKLTRSQESLTSIAADLGFSGVPAFHRAFRRWTNCTPGDYREARESSTAKTSPSPE
ncbi:MAG: AraC family transcriptional regulator [Burkholderiaceae bacterium]|nr:AraC family transcriptional regulator [Burkholderiaceae bacterium]